MPLGDETSTEYAPTTERQPEHDANVSNGSSMSSRSTTISVGTYVEFLDGYTGQDPSLPPDILESDTINQTLFVNVVPEPGTALLFGLGLAGLSRIGRRER